MPGARNLDQAQAAEVFARYGDLLAAAAVDGPVPGECYRVGEGEYVPAPVFERIFSSETYGYAPGDEDVYMIVANSMNCELPGELAGIVELEALGDAAQAACELEDAIVYYTEFDPMDLETDQIRAALEKYPDLRSIVPDDRFGILGLHEIRFPKGCVKGYPDDEDPWASYRVVVPEGWRTSDGRDLGNMSFFAEYNEISATDDGNCIYLHDATLKKPILMYDDPANLRPKEHIWSWQLDEAQKNAVQKAEAETGAQTKGQRTKRPCKDKNLAQSAMQPS